jgi:hypothetical protein
LALFIVFLLTLCWLLPKLWRAVRLVLRKIGTWLGLVSDAETRHREQLDRLTRAGVLSETEAQAARARLESTRA